MKHAKSILKTTIKKSIFSACCLLFFINRSSSQTFFKIPDSLKAKSFNYLSNKLDSDDNGYAADSVYAWTYLSKAKASQNHAETTTGFKHILYHSPQKLRLVYADSMIKNALAAKDPLTAGSAYLTRGIVFYGQHRFSDALNDFVKANGYLSKTNDYYQIYKAKYNIGLMKYYLAYYEEAYSLFRECARYYETEGGKPYLRSLHLIALCYQSMRKYERSSATNTLGIAEAKHTNDSDMVCYFEHCEGVNDYLTGHYEASITLLKKSVTGIIKNTDPANVAVAYFYLAKNYIANDDMKNALPYLKKVDSISKDGTYIRNDLWESYEILIAYYASINDEVSKAFYTRALLNANKKNLNDYQSLSGKMARDYTAKFQESEAGKAAVAKSRNTTIFVGAGIITLLAIIFGGVVYKLRKQQRIDREKFKNFYFGNGNATAEIASAEVKRLPIKDVSPEIRNKILGALAHFENTEGYRNKEIGLPQLTRLCRSNNSYVSKVINHDKNKTIPDYLDSLRIKYIRNKLITERSYRNYTIVALAEDAGFKTAQKFTTAFKKHTQGLMPRFFIEQIENSQNQE